MAENDSLTTVPKFSEALGISQHTTRAWIAKRKIEIVRLGRAIRIPVSEIARLREQGTVPAIRSAA